MKLICQKTGLFYGKWKEKKYVFEVHFDSAPNGSESTKNQQNAAVKSYEIQRESLKQSIKKARTANPTLEDRANSILQQIDQEDQAVRDDKGVVKADEVERVKARLKVLRMEFIMGPEKVKQTPEDNQEVREKNNYMELYRQFQDELLKFAAREKYEGKTPVQRLTGTPYWNEWASQGTIVDVKPGDDVKLDGSGAIISPKHTQMPSADTIAESTDTYLKPLAQMFLDDQDKLPKFDSKSGDIKELKDLITIFRKNITTRSEALKRIVIDAVERKAATGTRTAPNEGEQHEATELKKLIDLYTKERSKIKRTLTKIIENGNDEEKKLVLSKD